MLENTKASLRTLKRFKRTILTPKTEEEILWQELKDYLTLNRAPGIAILAKKYNLVFSEYSPKNVVEEKLQSGALSLYRDSQEILEILDKEDFPRLKALKTNDWKMLEVLEGVNPLVTSLTIEAARFAFIAWVVTRDEQAGEDFFELVRKEQKRKLKKKTQRYIIVGGIETDEDLEKALLQTEAAFMLAIE